MNLGEWLKGKRGRKAQLHHDARVNYGTIEVAVAKKLRRAGPGSAAERISLATGGEVQQHEMIEMEIPGSAPESDQQPSAD